MYYLLDGYNLLFKASSHKLPLETARNDLARKVVQHSQGKTVCLVFDAHGSCTSLSRTDFASIEIVYTAPNQCADSFIIDTIERVSNKRMHCVVSSDERLLKVIRALGGSTMSPEDFFLKVPTHTSSSKPQPSSWSTKRYEDIFTKRLNDNKS